MYKPVKFRYDFPPTTIALNVCLNVCQLINYTPAADISILHVDCLNFQRHAIQRVEET